MNIYLGNETNFSNNGLGFLTDIISAVVYDELNGNYELKLEYVKDGHLSEYLERENIIKCEVADGTKQLFRITNVDKNFKTITIIAKHIFYDLLNNFLNNVNPQNKNGELFLEYLLDNANFSTNFIVFSDITNTKSANYDKINPVQAIMGDIDNSMVKLFGGELKRDNFTINFLAHVGEDNGVKLIIGKNITGINVSVDITSMATRVMPVGYDGLQLPELYVDSPLINNYPTPKITLLNCDDVKYDPNDESAYHTLDEAYGELRRRVQEQYNLGLDKPQVNININWVELSKTEEYKQYSNLETVRLGDTITAYILGMNYETRVISTEYNVLKKMITNFQIGTFKPTIANQINSMQQSVNEINPTSILEQAQQNATQLITSAMGGYVYKTQNELYIMDNADPLLAQKVWRWNINGLGYSSTGINGTYGLAMTMDGAIVADFITTGHLSTNVIEGYGSLTLQVQDNAAAIGDRSGKTSTITQEINSIQAQISDIADITTSSSTESALIQASELQNIAVSNPIRIEIHALYEPISYDYPQNDYPQNDYSKIRKIKFLNTSTNDIFEYTLPVDLLYYDSNNYDTFVADYETNLITITKKCKFNADGTIGLLSTPEITTMNYTDSGIDFALTQGNYQVELPTYSSGFLFVRLMVINAYTETYATKVELQNTVQQTATGIISEVSATYETKEDATTKTNILSTRIKQTVRSISLTANDNGTSCGLIIKLKNEDGTELSQEQANITLSGLVKFTDLSGTGTTEINGSNIITGIIKSSNYVQGTSGTAIDLANGSIDTKNFKVDSNGNVSITGTLSSTSGSIGGFTLGNVSLSGSTSKGTMRIQRGTSASVDLPANGGRLMLGSIPDNGVALTTANRLIISDVYGNTAPHRNGSQIEIYTSSGNLGINASKKNIVLGCVDMYIDKYDSSGSLVKTYTTQSFQMKFSNGWYVAFRNGIAVGVNSSAYPTTEFRLYQ